MSEHTHELVREWNNGVTVIINRCVHCGEHFSDGEAIEIKDAELSALRATIAQQAAQLEQFQFLLVANNAVDAKDLGGVIDALYRRITELEKNTAQEVKSCHSTP